MSSHIKNNDNKNITNVAIRSLPLDFQSTLVKKLLRDNVSYASYIFALVCLVISGSVMFALEPNQLMINDFLLDIKTTQNVNGTVNLIQYTTHKKGVKGNDRLYDIFLYDFSFSIKDGAQNMQGSSYSTSSYSLGKNVVIEYLIEDPNVSRIKDSTASHTEYGVLTFSLFLLLLGIFSILTTISHNFSIRKMLKDGIITHADIEKIKVQKNIKEETITKTAYISFLDDCGQKREVSFKIPNEMRSEISKKFKNKHSINILYDGNFVKRNRVIYLNDELLTDIDI